MYNLTSNLSIEEIYEQGWLPQRNQAGYFYTDDNCSCRSRLQNAQLSSENRRILKKTAHFSYKLLSLKDFNYTPALQKQLSTWTKTLNWNFPASSIKTVFTNHILILSIFGPIISVLIKFVPIPCAYLIKILPILPMFLRPYLRSQ